MVIWWSCFPSQAGEGKDGGAGANDASGLDVKVIKRLLDVKTPEIFKALQIFKIGFLNFWIFGSGGHISEWKRATGNQLVTKWPEFLELFRFSKTNWIFGFLDPGAIVPNILPALFYFEFCHSQQSSLNLNLPLDCIAWYKPLHHNKSGRPPFFRWHLLGYTWKVMRMNITDINIHATNSTLWYLCPFLCEYQLDSFRENLCE